MSDKPADEEQENALEGVPIVIMAGGKGTRLYPFTKIFPKPLIPVGDIPIIERIIERFRNYGASEYYMTVNYKKNMIKSYFSDLDPEYSVEYVEEDKPLGNALTIVSALKNTVIPYGVLYSGEHGIVTSMEEKPKMSYFVNTGMYILNPELLNKIPEGKVYHMTDLANELIAEGINIGMYPISEDSFLDMGEFEEMRRMEKKLQVDTQ